MTNKEYIKKLRYDHSIPDRRENMDDADLLALLLSYTSCAENLQEIMADIADKFGTARDVYRCSHTGLMQIDKMTRHGAYAIFLVGKAMKKKKREVKVFKKDSDYEDFFLNRLSMSVNEELWAAVFTDDGKMLDSKKMSVGSSCHADIFTGDLIEFAVAVNSRKMVIAHSHPYAYDTDMSREDEYGTDYLRGILARCGIDLFGHVIISENKAKFYKCLDKEK